eukprot:CAMPEP_0118984702 /NCGR_PEP_ID=MMETSP1173-20130426/38343_1 /TAXON_ID=1034831 /ORGANISM="Rhizochromulina marina cf, Strain CCMP1243" /LENGTH=48 /DNA_ID= /DNA_START= /DNA_END= /DNA_ORIENTATION=
MAPQALAQVLGSAGAEKSEGGGAELPVLRDTEKFVLTSTWMTLIPAIG